ncbi:MAG TPA: exopolyphosphatase [Fibrobacteraceae bacterium]|nr:exopolyphosphatase [Fibrobacteraceae bacterium]
MERKRIRLSGKYRLITRSDFDGLVCGMLLREAGWVDSVLFTHPKNMQDGTQEVGNRDILVGLPYVHGCAMAFSLQDSDLVPPEAKENGIFQCNPTSPSVSRLVYSWLGGRLAFPRIDQAMLLAVDKAHSAQYSEAEILDPQDWVLLGFLMDARTGLGRFRDFRLSNYHLMLELIPFCQHHPIGKILKHPDVAERIQVYHDHQPRFREQILRCTQLNGSVAIIDLRNEETIWAGNRFLVYALFPQAQNSIHILWGLRRLNTVFAVGRSIVNPVSSVNIGKLMEQFQGGGRPFAGTCQVPHDQANQALHTLVESLNQAS